MTLATSPVAGVMAFVAGRRQWPPIPTLLSDYRHLLTVPREAWTPEHWRDYAVFLEREGAALARELEQTARQLHHARRRLSRGVPRPLETQGTLLTGKPSRPRGRPPGETHAAALECLELRAELRAGPNPRATDKDAVGEWMHRRGMRRTRANSPEGQSIIAAMSRIRRQSHNSVR